MTVRTATLDNGFRIVSEHMPGLQSASVGVWVTAGGRHETPEQNGIAHFLEHMAFKGTTSRNALQIAEQIEDVGGYINAYTSREVTAFYARILRNDVRLALDVISDILLNPLFETREIEIERYVILQEIGQALDTPDDVIFDWLQEKSYPKQALGRTILGEADRIRTFNRDHLLTFVDQHYGPEQMILSAAGAVNHEQIVEQAQEIFGNLKPRKQSLAETARFVGGERRFEKPLEQAHMALAFESPGYRDDDFYTGQVYSMALGGGMSSRLFQEVREKRGLCYTIFAQTGAYSDTGMTTIYAGTSEEDLADLTYLTIDEMKRAADDMKDDEVMRARTQMKAGLLMGLESPSSRAERLARMIQIWGQVPDLSATVEKIDSVTTQDVRNFAKYAATEAAAAMALYGPIAGAPDLSDLQARRTS